MGAEWSTTAPLVLELTELLDELLVLVELLEGLDVHVGQDVHVGAAAGSPTAIAIQGGACTLGQVVAPRVARALLRTDGGAVLLEDVRDCWVLGANPFPVFTTAHCAPPSGAGFRHLVTGRYDVYVHGARCPGGRAKKRARDAEVISLLRVRGRRSSCFEPGAALFSVGDLLPGAWAGPGRRCLVLGSAGFHVTSGALLVSKGACLMRGKLLELDLHCWRCPDGDGCGDGATSDHVIVRWRIGRGSFSQEQLERLLLRGAGSPAGIVGRRRRSVNTSPQFLPPMYSVSVAENQPRGTPVVTLSATDADEGDAGRLEYFMDALFDSRSDSLFVVDRVTGEVTTAQVLDRETKATHVFRVTAVDHGSPQRSAVATLTVTVSDTNDHDPVFEQQEYKESVRENLEVGYEVLTVRATDGDASPNANIVYGILDGSGSDGVFEIDPRSGVIRTTGPVDREEVDSYTLLVEASDQGRDPGPRSSTATVRISVEDDNDNAPQFSEKRYVVRVPENTAPNSQILQVTATDRDRGSNAVVHFSIMSGNTRGLFYIDAQTGTLDLVGQLDHETGKEFTLRIRAQDGGRPPLSNISGLVTVQVLDVNDNAPIFVSTPFQATVLENVPVGYSVIHVQAVDADSGDNSRLEYRLVEAGPGFPFSVSNGSGWIVVAAELDREAVDLYSFGVEARDHGNPPLSSSASVTVTVLDVNDNDPEFTRRTYCTRLNEDAAVGTSVVTVSAVDRDINSVVTYQISSGNTRNRFSITSQSGGGLITLALPLDYKLERQYVLGVTASDGTRVDSTRVLVNVTDANTHRPVFQSSHYTVDVDEDRPVGTTVVAISATDEDTGENSRITYLMEDSVPQFDIDPDTGSVTTRLELDYEDQVSYTLAITARDNGIPQKSDTTYLEILVNDVNDNAPRFLRDRYQGSVMEDVPAFTSVVQVSATDRDSGLNGRVFYTFHGGEDGDGDFVIESTSGIVRTLRRLDRENTPAYHLRAFAVDKGLPALRTPVDIQVNVLDVNDNPPVFDKDDFDIFVEENSPVGLAVARVTASDPDEGSNAQIMYQIVEGNIPEVFQLDIFSGELTPLVDLDYESRSEYVMVVQATSAPLVSRATVRVKLVDQNDNEPVLRNFRIIFNNYVTNKSSSFPSGVIGRVPARDPDVSDALRYRFEAGNELNLLLLNESTGEIQLSSALNSNRPLEATMRISVSDGVHTVAAQCLLQVTIITDHMLSNSITLRLANMSQERFLSPLLTHFLDGVARVLSASRDDVVVFNVQDDTDVSASVLNVSLSVALPGAAGGRFLGSEELRERLYLKRGELARASALRVLPFDDNVCLREPCENYMRCVSVLRFDSLAPFVASDTVLFRPIQPIAGLRCRCPPGFAGDYCERELDLCYSRPCGPHGACRSYEGGFSCECLDGYTGERCEVSSRSDRCLPGVCRNGATCVNLLVGGFKCECPPGGYEKPYCAMSSRSFPPRSFVTFRGLRQRFRFQLSLTYVGRPPLATAVGAAVAVRSQVGCLWCRFATRERHGLLFYNGRFNEKHDFIAMEIINEQVQLTFSAGETKTTVSPFVPGGVSDGQWHVVHVHYYNKPVLSHTGLPQGPSDEKVAVVTMDDCDSLVALKFGHTIGNYSCSAQGSQSGSKKSLDLTGPLLLGGVPDLPEDFPVRSRQFVGCMRDLRIDHRRVDMAEHVANNGTVPGCLAKKHFCNNNPCVNGGTCVNRWGSYSCDCPLGFGGRNCEKVMTSPWRFLGNSLMHWSELDTVLVLPWLAEMMFRTRQAKATLFRVAGGLQHSITLQVQDGAVLLSLQLGEGRATSLHLDELKVNDGDWHHLQLELRRQAASSERPQAALTLDYGLHTGSVELNVDLEGLRLQALSVGGVPGDGATVLHGFRGCVQGVQVGGNPAGDVSLSPAQAQELNVEPGCAPPDPCDSNPCPPNSYCSDDWDSYSCSCDPGYYGDGCTDVCSLNPCEHQSACMRRPGSAHGYMCDCPSGYFGQYCENRMDLPCPRGWWGHGTCGPCSCRTDRGFDADCNKTSGECRCKDNHYREVGGASCLPCDCYPMGSLSRTCDPDSGQCRCRPGVMGRRCDRCDNPFAEVSPSGCEVIYDSCPHTIDAAIWWPRTRFGLPAAMPCPKGSIGTAIRHCDEHKGWLPPNIFNCTSLTFAGLKTLLAADGSSLNQAAVRRTAAMLSNASRHTAAPYGSDVRVAYRLLHRLLLHESCQRGFDLAATQDVHFTENLVEAGSAALAPETLPHWQLIQQTEGGAADLLRGFEAYATTLARNMRKTYLSPFTVSTPHIVVSVDRPDRMTPAQLPRYEALGGTRPADLDASVTLPDLAFNPGQSGNSTASRGRRHPGKGHREAVASVIIFHSLGALLPERYDPDKRSLRVPKRPVINTPVVSIMVHEEEEAEEEEPTQGGEGSAPPPQGPITVQFRLLHTEERSKPICVFWNHSIRVGASGGWSARGCEVVFRNHSHISCQCGHMTSFAVLMDVSRRENGEILPLKMLTWSSVGVTLGFLLLAAVFLWFLPVPSCNRTSIVTNGAAALFLSELIFILGISQADSPFLCTVIAILLHFFYMCTFSWLLLEALHTYRVLSELRDIDYGPMRFYYMIGWGVPAFITGLAVGLDPEGYGNPDFCWLSIYDTLIWSFAGPIAVAVSASVFLHILAARASCSQHQLGAEKKKEGRVSSQRTSCWVLLLVTVTWVVGLLSVNSDSIMFHYLFAALNCVQGPFFFLCRIILNKEVRSAVRHCCSRTHRDRAAIKSVASSYNGSHNYTNGRLYRPPFGDSSVSLNSTLRSGKSHQSYIPFVLRDDSGLHSSQVHVALDDAALFSEAMPHGDGTRPRSFPASPLLGVSGCLRAPLPPDQDSDSDSDLSLEDDRSGSYGSTHSSDSEEDEDPYRPEACWESLAAELPPPQGTSKDGHVTKPFWPGEFVTAASESEGQGVTDSLTVETPSNAELSLPGARCPLLDGQSKEAGPHLPKLSAQPQKGILKKKPLLLPVDKSVNNRSELSVGGPASSQGSSSSEGRGGGAKASQKEHLNGGVPVEAVIRSGAVDEDLTASK
ncbi:cadherin EGF LAG seven-pass G-type receptor 2 [Arapaima gigas]